MMCLQVLIFLTWGIVFADGAAVEAFELVGEGNCAVTAVCGSWRDGCWSSYFTRDTDSAHESTNLEGCAADALQAGAQGFAVKNNGWECQIVPKQDPGMSTLDTCPSTSTTSCPDRSPYGSLGEQDYDYDYHDGPIYLGDWMWRGYAGVSPILGVQPDQIYSCYRLKVPTENPTEVPPENPTEGAAVEAFELVGEGFCAPTTGCGSRDCRSSFFYRMTDSAYLSTNLEGCAADALQAGAQGFGVYDDGYKCEIVPKQDPGMSNYARCPPSTSCPNRSPYGNLGVQDYDYDYDDIWNPESLGDWEWYKNAGVDPILGVYPRTGYNCYRLKVPTENPTEVPAENPTEDYDYDYDYDYDVRLDYDNDYGHDYDYDQDQDQDYDDNDVPTENPTEVSTENPTEVPTENPTEVPTEYPTEVPTENPTEVPTENPTSVPTENPTEVPTENPTEGHNIEMYCNSRISKKKCEMKGFVDVCKFVTTLPKRQRCTPKVTCNDFTSKSDCKFYNKPKKTGKAKPTWPEGAPKRCRWYTKGNDAVCIIQEVTDCSKKNYTSQEQCEAAGCRAKMKKNRLDKCIGKVDFSALTFYPADIVK